MNNYYEISRKQEPTILEKIQRFIVDLPFIILKQYLQTMDTEGVKCYVIHGIAQQKEKFRQIMR